MAKKNIVLEYSRTFLGEIGGYSGMAPVEETFRVLKTGLSHEEAEAFCRSRAIKKIGTNMFCVREVDIYNDICLLILEEG